MSNTVLMVMQGILAFVFLMAGSMKLIQPRKKVIASGGKWAEDFTAPAIKMIGAGEVLCALGIIVPQLMGHGDYVTSAAAAGIAIFMGGAFYTHLRRKESPFLLVTGVFFALAVAVGCLRMPGM
ncbi:MAG: DoxX family protein [Bdellovibrionota bacterium]